MKLVIQIPCFNEEETLPEVIKDLPKKIPGISVIEYLVIDDGSTDRTVEIARELGVNHILELGSNRGLAFAFYSGMNYALSIGADILVNTDGDNQYNGADISKLVKPLVNGESDMVVGNRPITNHKEFSPIKKLLQLFGSWTLRKISKTSVKDAPSGFRAFSKDACLKTYIYSKFSYTMETLIQAGSTNLRITSVDISVNPKTRESRLFKNIFEHLWKSGKTMIHMYILHRPGRFFFWIGTLFNLIAFVIGSRYLYLIYFTEFPDPQRTYLPSLILLAIFAFWGILSYFLGILGEIQKSGRKLSEENLSYQKRIYLLLQKFSNDV